MYREYTAKHESTITIEWKLIEWKIAINNFESIPK